MRRTTVRNLRITVATIIGGVIVSCARDAVPPTGARLDADLAHTVSGTAAQTTGGFYLLPPLAPSQSYSGVPDGTLSPRVSVCEWNSAAQQCGSIVVEFTTTSGPDGERVRYDGQHYAVNWKTDQCSNGPCSLDTQKLYRLRVHVGAAELGATNIVVVANASALKNVNTGEAIGLVDGRTLPVKFRIEQGAVSVVPSGGSASVGPTGGSVTTADGSFALAFPSGALASSTTITAQRVAEPPEGAEPFTPVYEFGPDGTTFGTSVSLTIAYDAPRLPEGAPEADLAMFWLRDGAWEVVPGSIVNEADNTVTAPILHFSMYLVGLYPRDATWQTLPTTLLLGSRGSAEATFTYCYFRCNPVRNTWIRWEGGPPIVRFDSAYTRTNNSGRTLNTFAATLHGEANIWATIPNTPARTPALRYTVVRRLRALVAHGNTPGKFDDPEREIGLMHGFALWPQRQDPDPWPITVSIARGSAGILPGLTASVEIPANSVGITGATVIPTALGVDTIIVSSPYHTSDTVIVRVGLGRVRVSGWPASLAYGDSAQIRLEPMDPSGRYNDVAYGHEYQLGASANLRFSDGTNTITSVNFPIAQYRSAHFWVVATGAGTGRLIVTEPQSVPDTVTVAVSPPVIIGPQAVCGHKITGIAFDGTYYYVGEGHDGLLQCLSRFDAATGYYVDHKQILLDHRGLHWIPSLNRLTSRTWGGPIFSIEYSSGSRVQLASNPTASRPGDEQSQPAVDADGVSYWILTAGRAERRRLSDHSLLKSFPVTSSAGYNVIAASDRFVFTLDGLGINGYSKNTGAFAGRQPLPHAHPCDGGIGLGVSANADRFMYLNDCRRVEVVPTTVQFVEPVWSQAANMLTPRWGMVTVAVNGKIYAIGGNASPQQPYPGGPVVSTVEVYDPTTDTWTTRAPLPVPLEHMMAAAYGGRIYVFGGWLCNLCGDNRMWAYDIAGNTWTQGPSPPFHLNGGTASVINDKIYITTGSCCGSPNMGFLMYDPGQGTYTVLRSSPRGHAFAAGAGVIDGKLYVAGGEGSYGGLDVYDPVTNEWSTAASMPVWRQHGAGVVVNGRLHVLGGSNVGPGSWADVYAYDPATNTWALVATSPTIRDLPSALLVNGVVYVMGGASDVLPSAPVGRVDRFHPY